MSKRHSRHRPHGPQRPAAPPPPANTVRPGTPDPLRPEGATLGEALGQLLVTSPGTSALELPRTDAADPLRAFLVEVLSAAGPALEGAQAEAPLVPAAPPARDGASELVRAGGEDASVAADPAQTDARVAGSPRDDASSTSERARAAGRVSGPAPRVDTPPPERPLPDAGRAPLGQPASSPHDGPSDTWVAAPGGAFRVRRAPGAPRPLVIPLRLGPQHAVRARPGSEDAPTSVAHTPRTASGQDAHPAPEAPGEPTPARNGLAAPATRAEDVFAAGTPVEARAPRTVNEVATRLAAVLAPGESLWVEPLGYHFRPLGRLARAARLEVCSPRALRPGDFVVVQRPDGELAAHVVLTPGATRSAPFLAPPDGSWPWPLARVAAVRLGGREVVLGAAARALVRAARATALPLRRLGLGRARLALQALFDRLPPVLWVRGRRVAPYEVRALVPGDAEAVRALVRRELPLQEAYVLGQLGERFQTQTVAIGAWDRRGRMVGLMYLGDYRDEGLAVDGIWLRSLVVSRRARGLGVARRMCEEAEWHARRLGFGFVKADLRPDNAPVLHLLGRWGFRRAPAAEEAAFNAACAARGAGDGWVVYQHALPATPQFLPRSLP